MNVYDFDGTIYDGDSSIDFYWFSLRKKFQIIKYLPKQIKAIILYKIKRINKTQMKEQFFEFLKDIDVDENIEQFWEYNQGKIKKWYLQKKKDDDLIISASPEFLLKPICKKIGIKNLIASKVNSSTGKFEDENCKGKKKVEEFNKQYKEKNIDEFYSDSLSDQPLANLAENAYFVRGDYIEEWPQNKKSKIQTIIEIYLMIYSIILLIICSTHTVTIIGEWDDYSLPVVSIIKQQNISIDAEDIENFKEMFPEWAEIINEYSLSGYTTRNGGQMTWYFPIYSLACVPFVLILKALRVSATYAFPYTNIASLMILLFVAYKYLKVSDKKKMLIILGLSISPIVFYIRWISAETLIFALIGIALICWYNKWYKRAAVIISLAGMMNPTILSIGIVMIIEYLIKIFKKIIRESKKEKLAQVVSRNIKKIICYGLCYIIALIPFIYNYYNTGHINLTASIEGYTQGNESCVERFLAYLFDFNFGILPYFSILFIISLILIPVAIYKKQWKYIQLMICFLLNIFLYSIMTHINCGMQGIARYNAWAAVIMILAVLLYFDEIITNRILKKITKILLIMSTLLTGIIIAWYGGAIYTQKLVYTKMLPIAEKVLNYVPGTYNPLHSTFNSRVNDIDGGYEYSTPIVYCNNQGYVKKILANSNDAEEILNSYTVMEGKEEWLKEQLEKLTQENTYISVPYNYIIVKTEQ